MSTYGSLHIFSYFTHATTVKPHKLKPHGIKEMTSSYQEYWVEGLYFIQKYAKVYESYFMLRDKTSSS